MQAIEIVLYSFYPQGFPVRISDEKTAVLYGQLR